MARVSAFVAVPTAVFVSGVTDVVEIPAAVAVPCIAGTPTIVKIPSFNGVSISWGVPAVGVP